LTGFPEVYGTSPGDHPFQMQAIAFDFLFEALLLESAVETGNHQFLLKRLHQIVVGAGLPPGVPCPSSPAC